MRFATITIAPTTMPQISNNSINTLSQKLFCNKHNPLLTLACVNYIFQLFTILYNNGWMQNIRSVPEHGGMAVGGLWDLWDLWDL